MKIPLIFLLFIFIVSCAGQNLQSLGDMPAGTPVEKIAIKGEDCKWIPNIVTVKKGSHVVLDVESVDWDYNFRLTGYNLRFEVPKGEKITAEFYSSKTGEFEFGCYIERGLRYHWGGMIGKLIVE